MSIKEEFDDSPMISANQLLVLAKEAEICGAKRFAEAYRLVANRLLEVNGGKDGGTK